MRTFGQLRAEVLKRSGMANSMANYFKFCEISPKHRAFWDEINEVEYGKGYVPGVYERPDSPALWQMELLTDAEFEIWLKKFESISRRRRTGRKSRR